MHLSCWICGRRTAMPSIQFVIQQRVYETEVQHVNDLRQHLTDVWAGVEKRY